MASLKEMLDIYNNCDYDCAICPNWDYQSYKCKLDQVTCKDKPDNQKNYFKDYLEKTGVECSLSIQEQLYYSYKIDNLCESYTNKEIDEYKFKKLASELINEVVAKESMGKLAEVKTIIFKKEEMTKEQLDFMKANYKAGDNND